MTIAMAGFEMKQKSLETNEIWWRCKLHRLGSDGKTSLTSNSLTSSRPGCWLIPDPSMTQGGLEGKWVVSGREFPWWMRSFSEKNDGWDIQLSSLRPPAVIWAQTDPLKSLILWIFYIFTINIHQKCIKITRIPCESLILWIFKPGALHWRIWVEKTFNFRPERWKTSPGGLGAWPGTRGKSWNLWEIYGLGKKQWVP